MNLSALWTLPVLFVCENNQYAVSTHCTNAIAGLSVAKRAAGYGFAGTVVDGNDLEAVHFAAKEAIQYVREGNGPRMLECKTYRIGGHYVGDPTVYRTKTEVEEWRKRDPVLHVERLLIERAVLTKEECRVIQAEVQVEIDDAVAFAENSPEPALESLFEDLYTGDVF
jgi:pyruvate dehydrogenase E1 component alpha subunit